MRKASAVVTLKCKCTEPKIERMSDDLIKIADTELNYIHFEKDSDDAINKSDEDFAL